MRITFLGAAGEVTGSQHLLEIGERRILLDCGLFQGHRAESRAKNEKLFCDPKTLDAVILSHAHMDHCGRLPCLVRAGYRGPIFCTPATADVAAIMLEDGAKIQREDAKYLSRHLNPGHPRIEPLYDDEDVARTRKLFEELNYAEWHDLANDVRLRFQDAGHILGSAIVELEVHEEGVSKRVIFSGDLGHRGVPLLRDPIRVDGGDVLICESTYGDRIHPPRDDMQQRLIDVIRRTASRGGRVIIPAFSLGRTQNVVFMLNNLANAGELPAVQVFVDSPLSNRITQVYRRHLHLLDAELQRVLRTDRDPFSFPGLTYIQTPQESQALNRRKDPFVVIAASGMCESGRVVHHIKHAAADERNTICLIGFQAEGTLGRRIQDGAAELRIYDRLVPLRADVESITGFSGHADAQDFRWWFERLAATGGVGHTFLVHGERGGPRALAEILNDISNEPPIIPQAGDSFEV